MGLLDSAKSLAGSVVDMHAHAAGDALDFVGLHDAAHSVDKWGDEVADDLGAGVGELNLGESEDPKDLLHGDAKAIAERVQHLMKFAAAFEAVATGLARMDSDHWKGKAADAFRSKFSGQPTAWRVMADACEAAAKGLAPLAGTVTWAQGQAKQAIDLYRKSEQATREAQDSYNRQADDYNRALKAYQSAGDASATAPARPAQFHDPGAALRRQAAELLTAARRQRVSAAGAAAQALRAATANAPKEPGVMDRIGMALQDAPAVLAVGALHFEGGVVKGAADMLKFARGVNPFDVYNITHPALYLDHLNSVAGGLAHTANHPTELVTALVGSGWGSDPSEAGGKAFFNLISGVATGGGSEAAVVAERLGIDAAESAARRAAVEAAENAAKRAAVETGESAGQKAATGLAEHPHPTPTPSNPAGLPDGWTIKPSGPKAVAEPVHPPTAPTGPSNFHPLDHGKVGVPSVPHGEAPAVPAQAHGPGPETPSGHGHAPEEAGAGHGVGEQPAPVGHDAPPVHEGGADTGGGAGNDPAGDHTPAQHAPDEGAGHSPGPDGPTVAENWGGLPPEQRMQVAEGEISDGARTFGNNREAYQYGSEQWNGTADALSAEEKAAVKDYTFENAKEGPNYKEINDALREGGPLSPEVAQHVDAIDRALAAHPLQEDVMVARATDLGHIKMDVADMPGRVFDEKSFSSASLGAPAEAFADAKDAILHLRVPEGTPALWVEKVGAWGAGEREILLGRNLQWRATRVVEDEAGKWHVYGEVL
ncbi:hypothetical protein GCM10018781_78830 [Kitasatospora indigofera]|uniref:ADP ribosyltransferase domain-containing protein n=1 Tax=Kitasatospora indigofera TaxID=67307 RepID=A0A919D9J7_9ACTN|nr:ADP-ribosyltransferase [Kitasatospora indigofera]GHE26570.1 hypothetical protein GCM10018781_78830 [Kitasatospora indigofera]